MAPGSPHLRVDIDGDAEPGECGRGGAWRVFIAQTGRLTAAGHLRTMIAATGPG